MEAKNLLINLAIDNAGDWNKIYEDIKAKKYNDGRSVGKNINALTILDANYPDILKQSYKPPFVLFYEGSISLLDHLDNTFAVLGNRKSTVDGEMITSDIVYNNRDKILVSGGSIGIQAAACRQAMEYHMAIILILGCGIDCAYPNENKDIFDYAKVNGLILSEYPMGTPPAPDNFPTRNRIIAALSKDFVVVETSSHSSTMITINYALSLNKDIYVVPQPYNSDLENNTLIESGAHVYTSHTSFNENNRTSL